MTPAASPEPGALARTLRGHMPVLDGIRGLAILLVLAHLFNLDPNPVAWPAQVLSAIMDVGWIGVQLFFVLSGFLITGILLDSRERPHYYRSFFARRVLRIFPLYYTVLLAIFVILPWVTHQQPVGYRHQVWLWLYLSNWAAPFVPALATVPHFWSLAVEEQFYLVWPWVVRKLSPRTLARLCGVLVILGLATRIALRALGVSPETIYMLTACRIDALAMGAAAAWALRTPDWAHAIATNRRALVTASAGLLVGGAWATHGYARTSLETQTLGYTVVAWGFVVFLMMAVLAEAQGERLARLLSLAPLRSVGKYSYAMYVFHRPLHLAVGLPLLRRLDQRQPHARVTLLYFVAMTTVTWAASLLSYQVLEKPFLRLKRHFTPGGAS